MAGRTPRDTLYSMGVVDTEGGATITVPEMPAGRYFSVYLVANDHYVPEVIYEPGTHKLPEDTKTCRPHFRRPHLGLFLFVATSADLRCDTQPACPSAFTCP
jgi:hypothetical protein